jgi:hypothetical protein
MPWSAVAERLSAWTLLQAGAVQNFLKCCKGFTPLPECCEIDAQIHDVTALLGLKPISSVRIASGGFHSSARKDDRMICSALIGDTDSWLRVAQECWLGAWLGWRWAVIMGLSKMDCERFRHFALNHSVAMPRRAESTVLEELVAGTPRHLEPEREIE